MSALPLVFGRRPTIVEPLLNTFRNLEEQFPSLPIRIANPRVGGNPAVGLVVVCNFDLDP